MALVPALVMVSRVLAPVIHAMDWLAKALHPAVRGRAQGRGRVGVHRRGGRAHPRRVARRGPGRGTTHYERLGAALEFSDKDAADVGVPLAGLVTVTSAATPLDIERLVAKHGFSRYPVLDDAGDLGGYLHLKDVLYADEVERLEPVPAKRVRRMANVAPRRRGGVGAADHAAHRLAPGAGRRRRRARWSGWSSSRTSSRSSSARCPTPRSGEARRR